MSDKKKGWPELGMIVKNKVQKFNPDTKEWEDVLDQNGQNIYKLEFKLADGVTILVDGDPVALNKGRKGIMKTPQQEVEGLIKAGVITGDDVEKRRDSAKEANKWCRYKVQLPPPRD